MKKKLLKKKEYKIPETILKNNKKRNNVNEYT